MAYAIRTRKETTYSLDFKGSKITGSPLSNKEYNQLRKSFTKTKVTRNGTVEKVDLDGLLIAKFQRVITGWDFVDEDGIPVPCTDETKASFLDLNTVDAMDILTQMEELGVSDAETEEKN